MLAIIKLAGNQHVVSADDLIKVNKLGLAEGEEFQVENVLSVLDGENVTVGTPTVQGAKVTAKVVKNLKDKKVIVFKKKRRQNYRRKNGHRQEISLVKILSIN